MPRTTDEVIDRFNRAFRERDATLLEDIIAPDCFMESVQPAPDGTRYEGYDASFSSWEALIDDTTSHFEVEDVHTGDEWALIRWRYVWGPGPDDSVRGVNVRRVVDGKIVEAAGYSKTAPIVAAPGRRCSPGPTRFASASPPAGVAWCATTCATAASRRRR